MKMDVSQDEQKKEEGYGVSGAVIRTSSTTNFDAAVSISMTPSTIDEDKSTIQTQNIGKEFLGVFSRQKNIGKAGYDDSSSRTTHLSADSPNTSMDTEERPSGPLQTSLDQFHAGCDDNSPAGTTPLSSEDAQTTCNHREHSTFDGGLLRLKAVLREFPLPSRPPPTLQPLPPEWKEIFDPEIGQNYYYNVKSQESTWERPRSGETLQEDVAEPKNSITGIGEPSDNPFSDTSSLPDEYADIVALEEKDGKHSTPSSSTQYSNKIQQEIDNHSVMKSRWRQFKSGGDQKVKKILTILFKPGISLDQKAFDVFSGGTPRSIGYNSTPTSLSPVPEEKKVMEFIKKLPIFELLEDDVLSAICNRLSLNQYSESSEVFRQDEPIKHMLFIIRGNLECRGENGNVSKLKEGDFCGEEALFRCTDTAVATTSMKSQRGKHPLSRRTIICVNQVEAYSLNSEALEYITSEYMASFASPLVQGTIRYFSQKGWSLAATTTRNTRKSKKGKLGEVPSPDTTSKLDDSTQNKEEVEDHDEELSNVQNVPTSEDITEDFNSSAPLPDTDEVPKMDARIGEDTPNAAPAPSRSNSAEKQREGDYQTGTKAWWQPFKSDGDQSGNKLIKWAETITKIGKNGGVHNWGRKSPEDLHDAASLTSPLLGENEVKNMNMNLQMEEAITILSRAFTSYLGTTPGEGENHVGKKIWWQKLKFQGVQLGKNVESTDTEDNTEEHVVDVHSPETTAFSEELRDIPKLPSPSLHGNGSMETNVRPEEQDTSSCVPVTSKTNFDNKLERENDRHSGEKIRPQTVKSGGYQESKKTGTGLFKSSRDHAVPTLNMIKKVPIFDLLEGHILEAICEHLSWKRYTKSSEVLVKDEPVTHMLFNVKGKLEYLAEGGTPLHLKEGDYCGDELLSWCTDRAGVSTIKKMDPDGNHPLSSRTVKCLTTVQAFSLDFQALEDITTQFKFAFRSPFVQGAVRYVSLDWRSLAATRIQQAWRFSKGIIGPGQGRPNDETELVQDTEQESSSTQEAGSNTEPPVVDEDSVRQEPAEQEESVGDNGDGVPFLTTTPPSEVISETANSVQTRPPSEDLSGTAQSAILDDDMTEGDQEADASNSGPTPPESDKTEHEEDDQHSAKKIWWRRLRAGHSEKKRSQAVKITEDLTMQLEGIARKFTYRQLKAATGGFAEDSKLGQGGFGSVYKGVLPSLGLQVAVKKMDSYAQNQGVKEFMAEVSIINRLRHRNLIQLHGWCDDAAKKKYLLVYELMPHGSLDEALFRRDEKETTSLSWPQRLNILTGTAAGLEYLHQGWNQQVIHRDIKLSNIMLDKNYNAKLGDFGLARLVDHHRAPGTTYVAGTMGYMAPEVIAEGRFTEKADVFGFGVVALEVASGRRVCAAYPDKMSLIDFIWHGLSEGDLLSTVDRRLHDDYDEYWMEVVLMVGLLCTHPDPHTRPSMRRVVQILAGDVPVPPIPASKPTPVFQSVPQISISDLHNRKARGHSKSASVPQIPTTSAGAMSSAYDSSLGVTRSSN